MFPEMYLYSSLLECKYFLVGPTVRRGMKVEVGVEIHVESESFCSETPDCEPRRRHQAIFLESHSLIAQLLCDLTKQLTTKIFFLL